MLIRTFKKNIGYLYRHHSPINIGTPGTPARKNTVNQMQLVQRGFSLSAVLLSPPSTRTLTPTHHHHHHRHMINPQAWRTAGSHNAWAISPGWHRWLPLHWRYLRPCPPAGGELHLRPIHGPVRWWWLRWMKCHHFTSLTTIDCRRPSPWVSLQSNFHWENNRK